MLSTGDSRPDRANYLGPVLFLAISILWLRLEDITLFQVDSIAYAYVAKLMSQRPVWEWSQMVWNGVPYYEHPPLMKWVLAFFIRFLGAGSLAATLPAVIFSTLSVAVLFLVARELWDDRYAMMVAVILCLSPTFFRESRNPMLEPPVTFFILSAILMGLLAIKSKRSLYGWLAGLAIAGGWLTKGPPVFIVWPALGWLCKSYSLDFRMARRILGRAVMGMLIPLVLFETWHYVQVHRIFFLEYFRAQILRAAIEPTAQSGDALFYVRDALTRNWPWLAAVAIAPLLVFREADQNARRCFWLGAILWIVPLAAFSCFPKKSIWYANITLPAVALLAAIPFQLKGVSRSTKKMLVRFCITIGVTLLFLGATIPSVFRYRRPVEDFFHRVAQSETPNSVRGKSIADCVGLDPWKGPFFLGYYLDAVSTPCDPRAEFQLVTTDRAVPAGFRVLFQTDALALIQSQYPTR